MVWCRFYNKCHHLKNYRENDEDDDNDFKCRENTMNIIAAEIILWLWHNHLFFWGFPPSFPPKLLPIYCNCLKSYIGVVAWWADG